MEFLQSFNIMKHDMIVTGKKMFYVSQLTVKYHHFIPPFSLPVRVDEKIIVALHLEIYI